MLEEMSQSLKRDIWNGLAGERHNSDGLKRGLGVPKCRSRSDLPDIAPRT